MDIANELYESDQVVFSHPNFIAETSLLQNDPLYPDQYYLNNTGQFGGTAGIDINAPEAWALSVGLSNVRVAVLDDGVEDHEDLAGRVVQGFTPLDPNGFGTPVDQSWHGQAVAGIIGATSNNNIGIAGIAQCTEIIPINIFTGNEEVNDIADGINWAWDDGQADVLSNSWSFDDPNAQFDVIDNAIEMARTEGRGGDGSVVVFSSGNNQSNFNGVMYPARVDGVVTVGAIDNNGNIWNYSSRGPQLELVAPSGATNFIGDVTTTDRPGQEGQDPGNYWDNFGGTSAAAPQVSGVIALMISTDPSLTENEIQNILINTAIDMGTSGFDNTYGFGRLNAHAAITQVLPTVNGNDFLCSGSNQSYSLSYVPANTTTTWSVSPTNLFANNGGASHSGDGTAATIRGTNFIG